ncbi:ERCC4 domain-containing protein [Bacillota bacterium Meth-B3]
MTIQIDSREKPRAITRILDHFDKGGITHFTSKLPVGDYMNLDNPRLVIDRKQNLQELVGNVCQQHKRFTDELKRAQAYGIKLIVLCEHGGQIKSMADVIKWNNPRLKASPLAMSGERLCKVLCTLAGRYGVQFEFCDKRATGRRITELLGGEQYDGKTAENG